MQLGFIIQTLIIHQMKFKISQMMIGGLVYKKVCYILW